MIIQSDYVDIPTTGGPMRTFVAAPAVPGSIRGSWCYSDIFQLTGTMLRPCARLAGYGFAVAAPEIYHRVEPAGLAIPFDDAGRDRGMADAGKTPVADFDADCRAGLDWLTAHEKVSAGKLGAMGFCIGGHLAFRAALQPDVKATVCFYGTGIHDGRLGKDADAGSLQRAKEIKGELLMIFGSNDPASFQRRDAPRWKKGCAPPARGIACSCFRRRTHSCETRGRGTTRRPRIWRLPR